LGPNAVAISGKWGLMAKEGYDLQFGARLLKRAIQEQVLNPLSLRLLEGDLSGLGFEPFGKWRKGFANGKGREAD
jgi:hypothetical protein